MKRITLTVLIAIFVLLGIVGCNESTNDASDPMMNIELSDISSVIENSSSLIDDEMEDNPDASAKNEGFNSQHIASETESSEYTEPSVEESSEVTEETSTPKESSEEESSEPPSLEESEEDSSVPEISENESSVSESSEESEESQPTEEIEPDESEPPIPSEPEGSEDTSSEAEPELEPFDIDYWIEYARDYAESVGLILHESAVDCWDTPIIATPTRTNLKGDIESRLNRYAYVEEFEWVWIWAEQISENRYNLYVGYA